jgi:hypothetical protein
MFNLIRRIRQQFRERALWTEAFRILDYLHKQYPDADRDGDMYQCMDWHARNTRLSLIRLARAPLPHWIRKGPSDPGRPWNG